MPVAARTRADDRSTRAPGARAETPRARRLVAGWLFAVAAMILVMVALGGATRLTGSGLSIMRWEPVIGILPPLAHTAWEKLFALYKTIPQYQILHQGMGLAGFKHLFWLEYVHRLWGRLLGFAFLLPLLWLSATGRIERRLRPRLVVLFLLGGLQGLIGWFMVHSGFRPDSTGVAPLRLALHLATALVLFAAIVWTALSVLRPEAEPIAAGRLVRRLALTALVLTACTIVAGSIVAGTHAGLVFNTFPLMGGRLVPAGYFVMHPWFDNLVHNVAAVQFDHRLLATLTVLAVTATVVAGLRARLPRRARWALVALAVEVALQYALGVTTLLLHVPLVIAVLHQSNAVLLLTAELFTLHALRGAAPARAPLRAPAAARHA